MFLVYVFVMEESTGKVTQNVPVETFFEYH